MSHATQDPQLEEAGPHALQLVSNGNSEAPSPIPYVVQNDSSSQDTTRGLHVDVKHPIEIFRNLHGNVRQMMRRKAGSAAPGTERVGQNATPAESLNQNQEPKIAQKSFAGFQPGHSEALGSFCVSVRGKNDGDKENRTKSETENMESKDFVQTLREKQQECYDKKFAFELGQFNQCIANPDPEKQGEMITVQLVKKVLHKYDQNSKKQSEQATEMTEEAKMNEERAKSRNVSQKYQNYTLESVNDKDLYDDVNCKD